MEYSKQLEKNITIFTTSVHVNEYNCYIYSKVVCEL